MRGPAKKTSFDRLFYPGKGGAKGAGLGKGLDRENSASSAKKTGPRKVLGDVSNAVPARVFGKDLTNGGKDAPAKVWIHMGLYVIFALKILFGCRRLCQL